MPDFLFDGPTKVITEPTGTGDTSFEIGRDIYSAWKRWVNGGTGAPFDRAFVVEGGTPIGATGLFTGTTFVMVNGWRIRPADHDHQVLLIGNLYSEDGIVSVPALTAATNVFISATVGAQGISTGSGLAADERQGIIDARDHARAANLQTQQD